MHTKADPRSNLRGLNNGIVAFMGLGTGHPIGAPVWPCKASILTDFVGTWTSWVPDDFHSVPI